MIFETNSGNVTPDLSTLKISSGEGSPNHETESKEEDDDDDDDDDDKKERGFLIGLLVCGIIAVLALLLALVCVLIYILHH